MYSPLLSIIIPVYGVEKYISQCLESVINQTYKNIEVIIINDGTKDNSAAIAREYVKRDNRVKVYDFENEGLSVARNRGLDLANGELIAFLDSDDWIAHDMYEILVNRLIASNADMVKCGFCETDGKVHNNVTFEYDFETSGFTNYFQGVLWTVVWNAVYKRELALKVRFPKNVVNEDNYASGMYIKHSNKITVISNILHYYRINTSGISKNSGGKTSS